MKSLITLIFVLLGITTSIAQSIETQSVEIDNLINFIAESYPQQEEDELDYYNITIALQVSNGDLDIENRFVLKQALKLLSNRLTEYSTISIVAYYGINGIALEDVYVKDLDEIYAVIENIKDSVVEPKDDGITISYQHAKDTFDEDANNIVFIVRNEKATKLSVSNLSDKEKKKIKRKKRNTVILTTAVALLPELIELLDK